MVICNAEWNRWALGAKEREKVAMTKGITALYNPADLGGLEGGGYWSLALFSFKFIGFIFSCKIKKNISLNWHF